MEALWGQRIRQSFLHRAYTERGLVAVDRIHSPFHGSKGGARLSGSSDDQTHPGKNVPLASAAIDQRAWFGAQVAAADVADNTHDHPARAAIPSRRDHLAHWIRARKDSSGEGFVH